MVPSWTETLIAAGVNVCGRTRFCLYPVDKVKTIPIVGGTKDIDWEKVASLQPDLLILDQEENPKSMADESPYPWMATHVHDLSSAAREMRRLGETFKNQKILDWADQWDHLLEKPCGPWSIANIPGEIRPLDKNSFEIPGQILYVIWKKPWLVVSPKTYIGSVLQFLGAPLADLGTLKKYPEISEVDLKKYYLMFSSEPFPFEKITKELAAQGFVGSLVDGEGYSWFGIRSLNFLLKAQCKSLVTKA